MFFGDNVIDMKQKFCGGFRKVTMLAAPLRTADDLCFQCAVRAGHELSRCVCFAKIAVLWTSLTPAGARCACNVQALQLARVKDRLLSLFPSVEPSVHSRLGQSECLRWLPQRNNQRPICHGVMSWGQVYYRCTNTIICHRYSLGSFYTDAHN